MKAQAILVAAFAALSMGAPTPSDAASPVTDAQQDHVLIFYTESNYKGRSETVTVRERTCSKFLPSQGN